MSHWYNKIITNPDDYEPLGSFLDYHDKELDQAKAELNVSGLIINTSRKLAGVVENRYSQLQEVEAVLEYYNIRYNKIRSKVFLAYVTDAKKAFTDRQIEKLCDADDDVQALAIIVNEVSLLRNKYLAIHKGLEILHYQISNIVKLRAAGLEDATF